MPKLLYDDYAASLRVLQRNRTQLRQVLERLRTRYPPPEHPDMCERFIGSMQNLVDGHTHLLKRLALLWQETAGGVTLGPGGEPRLPGTG